MKPSKKLALLPVFAIAATTGCIDTNATTLSAGSAITSLLGKSSDVYVNTEKQQVVDKVGAFTRTADFSANKMTMTDGHTVIESSLAPSELAKQSSAQQTWAEDARTLLLKQTNAQVRREAALAPRPKL
jgi:hypothetical protein